MKNFNVLKTFLCFEFEVIVLPVVTAIITGMYNINHGRGFADSFASNSQSTWSATYAFLFVGTIGFILHFLLTKWRLKRGEEESTFSFHFFAAASILVSAFVIELSGL